MAVSTPYWWEDAGQPESPPTQPLPTDVDVLVIGAGLTGASAAQTLAKHGKSVLVLDALSPGLGASSRNGGMVGGGHRLSYDALCSQYSQDIALRLMREAHIDSAAYCQSLIAAESIDCDFKLCGRFRGLWQEDEYESEARSLEQLQSLISVDADMVPREQQHQHIASDLYRGGVAYHQHGSLNPAKWHKGLLSSAIKQGTQVQGDTPVVSIERKGHQFEAATGRGTIKAGQVLAATNGYTPHALPKERRRIIPLPSFIIATEELGTEKINELFPSGRMIVESRDKHCYYRPSPDGKRIVLGARAALFQAPEAFAQSQLTKLLLQIFPQLTGLKISHNWRGNTGFSFSFLPHVGQIDGIWHAMGYSGSGNAMAPWLGHKVALQMCGEPEGQTAFSETDFPAPWWHTGRPWFLPAADVVYRCRDIKAGRRK